MAEKRKDSKGRVLRSGEVQRSDGKYMFRYVDLNGERQTVYSWRLVETDKTPAGKKESEALRTIEQKVLQDVAEGVNSTKLESTTVNMLFSSFMEMRTDLKETTRCNYATLFDTHVRNGLGRKKVTAVKYSDIFKFYMCLSNDKNLKIATIQAINAILWQLFEIPYKDGDIRKNPVTGAMIEVSHKLKEEADSRAALTVEQQSAFIDYVYSSEKYKKYGALFTTLLGTGTRIGECLGLRWQDIDFKNGFVMIDHAICYKPSESGGCRYKITAPKTKAGVRKIPLFSDVKTVLKKEQRKGRSSKTEPFSVDGYTGFIFVNSCGKVFPPHFIFGVIQNIVSDYNSDEYVAARSENREPHFLPKMSPHILRHTFCTRLCENEPNLKIIQEVMGHKNIRTTMNVYSHATDSAKQLSFARLEGKIKLA